MFQVCLSAIISKMCWEPELPKKTFCFSSKQRDSCSKVNTLCKLKRDYFSLFPSHLHHHLEIKAWCRNQRRGLRRPHLPRWRAQSQGRCFWKRLSSRLLCGNFFLTFVWVHVWKQQGQKLGEWQCVCGNQKLKLSDLCSETPASQLSLCLWHPTWPLALLSLPLKTATQEIESCFQTKMRKKKRTGTQKTSVQLGMIEVEI